jgi:glycogen debranching enzyme
VRGIAHALVLKDQDLYFLCSPAGQVPGGGRHGLGLYYHDCRFLNGYELRLADRKSQGLAATTATGFSAQIALTNPVLPQPGGGRIAREQLALDWQRLLDGTQGALHDRITIVNHGRKPVAVQLALVFGSSFEDIYAVRGLPVQRRGRLHPPAWHEDSLLFRYEGSDGLDRSLTVQFEPTPLERAETSAWFLLVLESQERKHIEVTLVLSEAPHAEELRPQPRPSFSPQTMVAARLTDLEEWRGRQPEIRTSNPAVNQILEGSLRDLHALKCRLHDKEFFAGGVPWYATLMGRDCLLACLLSLAFEPDIAGQTLRLLAEYQGRTVDPQRAEEPGKIPHEFRVGELARSDEIAQTPSYNSIDATPLFLILVRRHAAWTGDLTLFQELRGTIDRALEWMDRDRDGYVACSPWRRQNQGWKISRNAIVNADGSLARPPVALAEVQGYVYLAKLGLADLFANGTDWQRSEQLRQEADELRTRFNREFWLHDKGLFALALQAGRGPAAVVSSNAGQVLWAGIADPERAARTAERLMAEDMFSGWGIRTLSAQERRYNPLAYHAGTVWPHDNALIAAGFRRYGLDEAAAQIFTGLIEAAMHLPLSRLPEALAGFARKDHGVPVPYPLACHPHALAAAAAPYLLETVLGLVPEALNRRLRIMRPLLPNLLDWVEVRGLRVGRARADLRFERGPHEQVAVKVNKTVGNLGVVVETAAGSPANRPSI